MDWKCIYNDRPEIGKWYIVVDRYGKRMVRYYGVFYHEGLKSKRIISAEWVEQWGWGWRHYECEKQIPFEGFSNSSSGGLLCKEPVYFMELPPLPEMSELDKCKNELNLLQQKIKKLEEAINA